MNENWVPINGFEGLYSVSDHGRIRTETRLTPRNILITQKIKELEDGGNGYLKVKLSLGGVKYGFWVHRIVASHFIANPNQKKEVNHIDSNPKNNHVSNLEWVTPSENMKHLVRMGRSNIHRISKISQANRRRKIIQMDVSGNVIRRWDSVTEAAKEYGTTTGDICSALNGRQKTSRGFKWQYGK